MREPPDRTVTLKGVNMKAISWDSATLLYLHRRPANDSLLPNTVTPEFCVEYRSSFQLVDGVDLRRRPSPSLRPTRQFGPIRWLEQTRLRPYDAVRLQDGLDQHNAWIDTMPFDPSQRLRARRLQPARRLPKPTTAAFYGNSCITVLGRAVFVDRQRKDICVATPTDASIQSKDNRR